MSSPRDRLRRTLAPARSALRAGSQFLFVGPSGWRRLLRARGALLRAERRIRNQPQGALFRDIARTAPGAVDPSEVNPDHARRVKAIGVAIERMARWGRGRPLCLARSLAFRELLEREGIPGSWVRVGVRMGPRGFEAHAWVEWGGRVVGEDPAYVAGFAPLSDPRADPRVDPLADPRVDPRADVGAADLPWAETGASHDA